MAVNISRSCKEVGCASRIRGIESGGAIEITYVPQDSKGKDLEKKVTRWSRVKNTNTILV